MAEQNGNAASEQGKMTATTATHPSGAGAEAGVPKKASRADPSQPALLPLVDVIEDAAGLTLYADMPGVTRDSLTLELQADSLTIEGEVDLNLPQGMESSLAEIRLPRYRRVFTLSKELDTERASAEFKQGVLTLRIPKAEHAQPRRIDIQVA